MPVINAGSLQVSIINSDLYASLSPYARDCLTVMLWNIHPNEWKHGGKPVSRLKRHELAETVNACLKTVQRALVELEEAGFIRRLFNEFHHATGVDLMPLVNKFHQIRARAQDALEKRRARRLQDREARQRAKASLQEAEKNLQRTVESSQMDTRDHSNTNPPLEDESSCTGLEKTAVANSDGGHTQPTPFAPHKVELTEHGAEKVPSFTSWRWAILTIHPRYRDIAAANTDDQKANNATLDDLLHAAEVLRQEIGFRRADWERAINRHGPERALAYFVTMSSPAARMFRQIRNTQGYIVGGLNKPPTEFRPFQSMWAVLQEMKERS